MQNPCEYRLTYQIFFVFFESFEKKFKIRRGMMSFIWNLMMFVCEKEMYLLCAGGDQECERDRESFVSLLELRERFRTNLSVRVSRSSSLFRL